MVDQLFVILNSEMTLAEIEALDSAKRQRLADLLHHWHQLAKQG